MTSTLQFSMPRVSRSSAVFVFACMLCSPYYFAAVYSNGTISNKNVVEILAQNADGCVNVMLFRRIDYAISWDSLKNPDATYAFYASLTCMVSEWTSNEIQTFVQKFPLFYQREFANTERAKEYANNFDGFVESARSMNATVERFLNVLYGVLLVRESDDYYASYSNDISIVRTLLSLHVKLSLMSLERDKALPEFVGSDAALIREMLEEMNAIQGYVTVHCGCRTPPEAAAAGEKQPKLHGYFAANNPDLIANIVSDVLQYARSNLPIDVDSSDGCTVDRTFLYDVVSTAVDHDDDAISDDVAGSRVKINRAGIGTATIRELHDLFRRTHDLQLLYLYDESVITAILKTLYTLVLTVLYEDRELSSGVKKMIADVHSEMRLLSSAGNFDFPGDMVDGFELLTKIADVPTDRNRGGGYDLREHESTAVLKLYDLCTSMDVVIRFAIPFVVSTTTGSQTNTTTVIRDRITRELYVKKLRETDETVEGNDNNYSQYLEKFLTRVHTRVGDFACFHRRLKRVRIHYGDGRQRVPFGIKNIQEHSESAAAADESDRVTAYRCNFVSDMFLNYYETVVFVNRAEEKEPHEQHAFFDRAWSRIQSIKSHFLAVVASDTDDSDLLAVAYNVVTMLVNQKISKITMADVRHVKKVMNAIMVELNGYALRHCGLPEFNFLLVNNANVVKNINGTSFGRSAPRGVEFSENSGAHSDLQHAAIEPTTAAAADAETECFYMEYLRSKFTNVKPKSFKKYNKIVRVYWKGKVQSVEDIFIDVQTFMFLNPRDLYSLYDVYFHFFIAVVYFELKNYHTQIGNSGPDDLLSPGNFPREFKRLISDVNELWTLKKHNEATAVQEKCIEQQFENVIVFKDHGKSVFSWHSVKRLNTSLFFNRAAKISSMVKDVSQCYGKITNRSGIKSAKTVSIQNKHKNKIIV